MIEATNIYEQVSEYRNRQLSVIALASKSKKPQLLKWEKYQSVIANEDQLKQWFPVSEYNYNNVGIITGTVSKILAIDNDGEEAHVHFQAKIAEIQDDGILNAINNTMKIRTGSGNINIVIGFNPDEFASTKGEVRNRILWKGNGSGHSEIRIKGEGGYIVVPPSIHPNGNRYESVNGLDIITLSKDQIMKIFDAFSRKNNHDKIRQDQHQYSLDDETISDVVDILRPYCQQGIRNDLLMYLSGWLKKEKVSIESAFKVIDGLTDNDEEKQERFTTLEATYNKTDLDEVSGYSGLLSILSNVTANEKAIQILNDIKELAFPNTDFDSHNNSGLEKKTQSKQLVDTAESNTDLFFLDQYDTAYAKVSVGDHHEVFPIKSSRFVHYITKLFFDYYNGKEIPSQESLNNAIRVLEAKTEFGNQRRTLNLRLAWGANGEIYYDLTDQDWRYIKITKDNWQIVKSSNSEVLFTRFSQTSQVEPDGDYSSDIFDKYLDLMNISDQQHRLLLKVITICSFIPDIPHPICIPYGEQGSCKSTFSEFQKRIIDPSKINLLTITKDKSEFVQQLHHNYLVVYDNISYLPPWFSDEVCKAVTGVGNSKRRLYSDDEDVIVNYRRCIIINGINNNLTEPDALDRSILIELERIPNKLRKEESRVEIQFEEIRPKLLGYILDILVKALRIKPGLELSHLPRMADFAVWGEAIARAMSYKPIEFIDAYNRNIKRHNIEVIESNCLAQAIEKFVCSWYRDDKETCWTSSTSKVLENLNKIAQTYNIDTSNKDWPKASNSLTKRLRPLLSNLREGLGIHVVMGRNTTGTSNKNKNTSIIRIWKEPPPSPPSPPSPASPTDQNLDRNSGGSLDSGDITSSEYQVSPPQIDQNHAQKLVSGGSGGSGGFIPTLIREEIVNTNSNVLPDMYVSFDFEWSSRKEQLPSSTDYLDIDTPIQITAAAFVNSLGDSTVLHIIDFSGSDNPEYELLVRINQELMKYDFSVGWYSTGIALYHEDTQEHLDGIDSDLAVLNSRCLANGIDSIVNFNTKIPNLHGQKHIDLHSVFGKPMVQTTIFKNAYRTLKLDEVSRAVLRNHVDAGKYKGLTGVDICTLPIEEQKKYVLRDAELVMQLSKHNNFEVLDAMKAISEITGLDFERVCRTGISTWWTEIYDQAIINGDCQLCYSDTNTSSLDLQEKEAQTYKGAAVLQPRKGMYHNLVVVDVTSLYPSMAVLHNISFDTVNCECCKCDPSAKIPCEISNMFNSDSDRKDKRDYWICKQTEGIFPKKLRLFKDERIRQKESGNTVKQMALKILINGGYGVFGSRFFKYYDPRVAELITAYGRYTLTKMQKIAEEMGLRVIYGDTDSLFIEIGNNKHEDSSAEIVTIETGRQVNNNNIITERISKFKEECNRRLGVEVEHAKTYKTALISDKKKHYIGWTGISGTAPEIVGMEGDKNDRPRWINYVFRQVVEDVLVSGEEATKPISTIMKSISDLEVGKVSHELLARSVRLSKNPEEYHNANDRKRRMGLAIGARKGDVIEYYESNNNKEGYSLNHQDVSIRKYKLMLWKTVKEVLEVAGYKISSLEQELGFDHNKKGDKI